MSIPVYEDETSVQHERLLWLQEKEQEMEMEKEQEETEGIQKKRRLQPTPSLSISDLGPKLPFIKDDSSERCTRLLEWLPRMAYIIWSHDFSFLLEFRGLKVDIKYALRLDLVGLCVWLLYAEAPPCLKAVAARALATFYNATDAMFDDNIDTHPMPEVDNLVKTVLHSKNEQVLRQACCALTLLAYCRRDGDAFAKDVTFGGGVLKWLLELVKHDSPNAAVALSNIARVDEGMRDIIIIAELEKSYLPGLLKGNNVTVLNYGLWTIAWVTREDNDIWNAKKGDLIPGVVKLLQTTEFHDTRLAAACVINNVMRDATPDQIENLVDMGCLETLCSYIDGYDSRLVSYSLEAIKYILCIGDEGNNGNKYENKYANRITDTVGWSIFWQVEFFEEEGSYLQFRACEIKKYFDPDEDEDEDDY